MQWSEISKHRFPHQTDRSIEFEYEALEERFQDAIERICVLNACLWKAMVYNANRWLNQYLALVVYVFNVWSVCATKLTHFFLEIALWTRRISFEVYKHIHLKYSLQQLSESIVNGMNFMMKSLAFGCSEYVWWCFSAPNTKSTRVTGPTVDANDLIEIGIEQFAERKEEKQKTLYT